MQSSFRITFLLTVTLSLAAKVFADPLPAEIPPSRAQIELLKLARDYFNEDISSSEYKLFRSIADGEAADYRQYRQATEAEYHPEDDPANAAKWGSERFIRADHLRWLCTDRKVSDKVTSLGITVIGAGIYGTLDLHGAKIAVPFVMWKCFTDSIELYYAHLLNLILAGTYIEELDADGMTVDGDVFLASGFKSKRQVRLPGVTVGGDLNCGGGQFMKSETEESALNAATAKIEGNVFLTQKFEAHGNVSFPAARIAHFFEMQDVVSPDAANLDLRSASVGTLMIHQSSWPHHPGHLHIDGLVYDSIDPRVKQDAKTQLQWLALQSEPQFLAQPYEQLAKALRNIGFQDEATKVVIAKNEAFGQHLPKLWNWYQPFNVRGLIEWCWYNLFGKWIGYGYRPWNTVGASLLIVCIGSALFWISYRTGILTPKDDKAYNDYSKNGKVSGGYPKF